MPFSVVQIARDSRACWPAYSENCITLTKGEEVVVHPGMQISLNPRRGLYCLRPLRMKDVQCYFADLSAIEIDGVPVPTIRMEPDEERRLAEHVASYPAEAAAELSELYWKWAYVTVCNQARQGYALQYVNDIELDRARRGVQGAERELLKRHPALADWKEQIWQTAVGQRNVTVHPNRCRQTAVELWNASSDAGIVVPRP